jgi:hypothetical protein
MPLTDTQGRRWAHSSTVKAGDVLECDGGFTCMCEGDKKVVKELPLPLKHCSAEYAKDPFARLYVDCTDGTHTLDGQIGEHGELVGLYAV